MVINRTSTSCHWILQVTCAKPDFNWKHISLYDTTATSNTFSLPSLLLHTNTVYTDVSTWDMTWADLKKSKGISGTSAYISNCNTCTYQWHFFIYNYLWYSEIVDKRNFDWIYFKQLLSENLWVWDITLNFRIIHA